MSKFGFVFPAGYQEAEAIQFALQTAGLYLENQFYQRQSESGHIFVIPQAQTARFADIHPFLARCAFSTVIAKAEKLEYYRLSTLFKEAEAAWRQTPEIPPDAPEYA